MRFTDFKTKLQFLGVKADTLHFTNYTDYISVYKNARFPSMDGVDRHGNPKVEYADIDPVGRGKFSIKHPISEAFADLIRRFANTPLDER